MNAPVLSLHDIDLYRGERRVLAGTTFAVSRGECVALMGPSGVGKTTVLRLIAGLESFQSGTVQVEDIALGAGCPSPAVLRRLRSRVGLVFQSHHLFEHFSVLKNVWLAPVYARGVSRQEAERRARALLAALGVEHRAAALPRELSGGEAQRVAIARALAVDPPLLLMDEPTAALDADRRTGLRDLLRGLAQEGRTLVVATHDEAFARDCATRLLRVHDGRVAEDTCR
jgi:ABC-type polar amino acid transport system ATPase subunit